MIARAWHPAAVVLLATTAANACTSHREPATPVASTSTASTPDGAVCRVGLDGGPVVADRGIGGTGAPSQVADRGIGGTGIIGVITGFGSVCVGGQEVALGTPVPVSVDTRSADPSVLRAGQLVAVSAYDPGGGLVARSVAVRHEVSGPVEAVAPGRLRVAGQDVVLTSATWMIASPTLGDWVAVSGLRMPGGGIEATRVDRRAPGPVLVHGTLTQTDGRLRVGALVIAAGPQADRYVGQEVTAGGVLLGDALQPDDVEPDRLVTDPGGYFGVGVTTLLVEGFVSADAGGRITVGRTTLPAGRGLAGPGGPGRAVVAFNRSRADGGFEAVGVAPGGRGLGGGLGVRGGGFTTPAPGASRGGAGVGNYGGPAGPDRTDAGGVPRRSEDRRPGSGEGRARGFGVDGPGGGSGPGGPSQRGPR